MQSAYDCRFVSRCPYGILAAVSELATCDDGLHHFRGPRVLHDGSCVGSVAALEQAVRYNQIMYCLDRVVCVAREHAPRHHQGDVAGCWGATNQDALVHVVLELGS